MVLTVGGTIVGMLRHKLEHDARREHRLWLSELLRRVVLCTTPNSSTTPEGGTQRESQPDSASQVSPNQATKQACNTLEFKVTSKS
jgi:hypothetical protein